MVVALALIQTLLPSATTTEFRLGSGYESEKASARVEDRLRGPKPLSEFVIVQSPYNLGNFLRRLCLPKAVRHWSLRSVQVKLIKMGGRLVRHARRLIFQLSEGRIATCPDHGTGT